MNIKPIIFLIAIGALLVGSAYAAGVNDFKVDSKYSSEYQGQYYSFYLNKDKDAGIAIYKNVDDNVYDDVDNDDVNDHLIPDDGREYITGDDDLAISKNADNTANFTDYGHATHGDVEVVKSGGEEYIVVFFAKDSSKIKDSDLTSLLEQFNKDNNVEAVSF